MRAYDSHQSLTDSPYGHQNDSQVTAHINKADVNGLEKTGAPQSPTSIVMKDLESSSTRPPSTPEFVSSSTKVTIVEGGAIAWGTVFGSWLIFFGTLGYMYSFGVFQDYYTRVLLSSHSPSKIAWIGSVQLMLPFFLGALSGKLFDAGYFQILEISGAIIFTASLFLTSLVEPQQYYQAFLAQGIGMGLGLGLTFVPNASIVVHHFKRRRALATGVALSGGAMGSVVFPISTHLVPQIGFKKAVQSSAYIVLGFLLVGNCLVRTAYPKKGDSEKEAVDIKGFFVDPPYMCGAVGGILANLGIFFPIVYLQLYAVQHQIDPTLAFYSISIVNGLGVIGRIGGNFLADIYGPINLYIPCTLINAGLIFAILGVHTKATLITFSVLFGLFSGAWLSLSVSGTASLARRPDEIGARTGISLVFASFGVLGSAPTQGHLLTEQFDWFKPIIFSVVVLTASAGCFTAARVLLVRERGTQKV